MWKEEGGLRAAKGRPYEKAGWFPMTTLIRHASRDTFPLVGGRLGRAVQCAAPTGEAEHFGTGGARTRPYEIPCAVPDWP